MKAVERWKQVKEEKSLHFPFKAPCVAGFKKSHWASRFKLVELAFFSSHRLPYMRKDPLSVISAKSVDNKDARICTL